MAVPPELQSAGPLLMGRWIFCCLNSTWGSSREIISHYCPPLAEAFRRMWLMALLSQSQWDTWLYLLKSKEMLRHLKMERPNQGASSSGTLALHMWLIANGKVRRSERSGCHLLGRNRIQKVTLGEMLGFGEYGLTRCLLVGPSLPLQEQQVVLYQLWDQSGQEGVHPTRGAFPNREEPPVPQGKLAMCSTVSSTSFVANINEKTNHQKVVKMRGGRAASVSCLPA